LSHQEQPQHHCLFGGERVNGEFFSLQIDRFLYAWPGFQFICPFWSFTVTGPDTQETAYPFLHMPDSDRFRQRLLIKANTSAAMAMMAAPMSVTGLDFDIQPLFPAEAAGFAGAPDAEAWMVATPRSENAELHPWDWAHRLLGAGLFAAPAAPPVYIEPDILHEWPYQNPVTAAPGGLLLDGNVCQADPPDLPPGGYPDGGSFAWHLKDSFSQLKSARDSVGAPASSRVRIGILDTGYDPNHGTKPLHLRTDLQYNFVEENTNAADPESHVVLGNPGHGTGTIGILAGKRINNVLGAPGFDDFLGGAPHADVIPVRIARSVVHFYTSGMAQGIRYAIAPGQQEPNPANRCDVVSVSMGGVASRLWAEVVNAAYDAGVAIFAAAGNNFGGLPTRNVVYPARFNRVVAVCGATADYGPYYKPGINVKMQGNFGPASAMRTALAAYTPNIAWAEIGCANIIDRNGAGTSSATPQAAAAAALWLQKNGAALPRDWRRIEAVRKALFDTADTSRPNGRKYFGRGIVRARHALDLANPTGLRQEKPDSVSFPFLRVIFALRAQPAVVQEMLELETLQVLQRTPALQAIYGNPDRKPEKMSASKRREFAEALRDAPESSNTLKRFLAEALPHIQ
jgi:hypothetical protein